MYVQRECACQGIGTGNGICEIRSSGMTEVSVREIFKSYGKVEALRGVSFEAERGELFGIIGPDGAGKSTLFRILTTLLVADSGSATVAGHDVVKEYNAIRACVGYMPGRFSLYQDLTVEENMEFFASVFGTTVEENYDLVADIYRQIEPFKKRKAGKLSGGMKQKLALSCAMIHRPRVLFLDEPTTGVDPVSRKEFWQMLGRLKEEGITIVVSTPYMDEASLCDRIALIMDGRFIGIDTPRGIVAQYGAPLYAVRADRRGGLLNDLRGMEELEACYAFGNEVHITAKQESAETERRVAEALAAKGYGDVEVRRIEPTVEDCFMKLSRR